MKMNPLGRSGLRVSELALGWIMRKPFVASALLGARTRAQLEELLDTRAVSARAEALLARASAICSRP